MRVAWYPAGFYIIEQGEASTNLYLMLSGIVEIVQEQPDGSLEIIERKSAGEFFGEAELAQHRSRQAHAVAIENVTCLVFSSNVPTAFIGRGQDARITGEAEDADGESTINQIRFQAPTVIDVSAYIQQKVAAIAAHASQFPLKQDMLPLSILQELMGREFLCASFRPLANPRLPPTSWPQFPLPLHPLARSAARGERCR